MLTMISFSGGRTSAMMAAILCENLLEDERIVCFANTGKEHEATLEFVRDWENHFGVKVYWVEYIPEKPGFKLVDFESASRNGEPYAELIEKRKYVPNVVSRFCTAELKIRPIKKFIQSLGFKTWINAVGIRYDEPRRNTRLMNSAQKQCYENAAPLYKMRITKPDVLKYWQEMPFNLALAFKKHIIKTEPERVEWWMEQEQLTGATFRNGLPYEKIKLLVEVAPELFDSEIEVDCLCTID